MSESKTNIHTLEDSDRPLVTRRDTLKLGAVLGTAYKFPWLAETAGSAIDAIISPESIIDRPIIALEPREHTAPSVEPLPHGETVSIHVRQAEDTTISLPPHLYAEHSYIPLKDERLAPAGVAIVTTAEGLVKGVQEYCTLFQGETHTLAIGYEGGLYAYEPSLGKANGSNGEWVRVITPAEQAHSPASPISTNWIDYSTSHEMLIEKVAQGTKTLQKLGYRPWAATLPSTQMPEMTQKHLTPEICATSIEDAVQREPEGEFFCVTEKGDLVDLVHLKAKAGETFDLYVQLYYMHLAKEPQPVARVRYSEGTDADFEYAVSSTSLHPNTLQDTTFSIMTTTSMLMEGISQRYMAENIPLGDKLKDMGGLGAEDLFSNSLGIVGMLSLLQEPEIMDILEEKLRAIRQQNRHLSTLEARDTLETTLNKARDTLANLVLTETIQALGVTPQENNTITLPRGLSPLIPTKVDPEAARTPTRINLKAAGIDQTNPKVGFVPVHVPAMRPTVQRILEKIGL